MTGKIHTITKAIAKVDQAIALRDLMVEVADIARQEEGCLRYDLWQGIANPSELVAIGEWVDEASFQRYYRSGYVEEFMREVPDLVSHPPDIQWYTAVVD